MLRRVPTITPDERVTRAREILRETGHRLLFVVDPIRREKLLGLVRRLNVLNVTSTRTNLKVNDIMSEPEVILEPNEDSRSAVRRMLSSNEWYAPVVKNGVLQGLFGLEAFIGYHLKTNPSLLEEPIDSNYTRNPEVVREDDDVGRVWRLMLKHKYAGFPVIRKDGKLIGVITQYDLLRYGFARPQLESEGSPRKAKVRELFSTPALTVSPDDSMKKAAMLIISRNIGRVYVEENERLIGVIDREDLARFLLRKL